MATQTRTGVRSGVVVMSGRGSAGIGVQVSRRKLRGAPASHQGASRSSRTVRDTRAVAASRVGVLCLTTRSPRPYPVRLRSAGAFRHLIAPILVPRPPTPSARHADYPTRVLASLAVSLAVVLSAFLFWPSRSAPEPAGGAMAEASVEMIDIEEIEPTRQAPPNPSAPPPPPPDALLPPEEVPDTEEPVEQQIVEQIAPVTVPDSRDNGPPTPPPAPPSRSGPPSPSAPQRQGPPRVVDRPDRSPRVVRQAFPVYPEEARRDGVRARVRVQVLVTEGGAVAEARVVGRFRLDGDDAEAVAELPRGMDEAALAAARRYVFRPARDDGERVRARTILSLTFDPSR